ncbi:MAG: (d)CMP kinase [Clostridia bacterium]|jgi:cytidylate kinase|nr:(d)CMP kinase [Clostridia bacterium]
MKPMRIAIDGPSGAGKSTIAKEVAKILEFDYIDTGAMYRAVGYKMIQRHVMLEDAITLNQLLDETTIDFHKGRTLLDGEDVSDYIRTPAVSQMASDCSALPVVREKLVELQRELGKQKSVVMDGRDIGTNVFPDAEIKFFVTASAEERAKRRYLELLDKGETAEYQTVLSDMKMRDYNDSTRSLHPLKQAEDSILVDTTYMTIEEVIAKIMEEIERCQP